MRTRWGKFKSFQYLALIPSILGGIYTCMLPLIANYFSWNAATRLIGYMVLMYYNETVGAFFGGGGYIENVFTPNPNERTSLLVSARFVGDLLSKFPSQLFAILLDLRGNGILKIDLAKLFVTAKWVVWTISMVSTILWYLTSKERVPQWKSLKKTKKISI